jgi:4-hydroxyphenylacetate 3-monooxygenase
MRSGTMDAKSRTALVRLLWDFLGTEFGSRHQQYEKFYGGSSSIVKQNVYRNFDFKRATALVDRALGLPPSGMTEALIMRPYCCALLNLD